MSDFFKNISNRFGNNSKSDYFKNISNRFGDTRSSSRISEFTNSFKSNDILSKIAFFLIVLVIFVFILNLGISLIESMYKPKSTTYLVRGLINGNNPVVISQNPKDLRGVIIGRSNNELSGIEFTWSVWLVLKNNVTGPFRNIFNKGDSYYAKESGFSMVNNGPGLYVGSSNSNVLAVVMDTVNPDEKPSTTIIEDIPYNKWFHVTIRLKNNVLDTYVNGVVAKSTILKFVPKQNYNDVNVCQNGGFDGQLSDLKYSSYALSAFEINRLVAVGPTLSNSSIGSSTPGVVPPYYLSDKWFTSQR